MRYIAILILMHLSSLTSVYAGGLSNLLKFAQSNGSMTSINKGAVISDQSAGYMTGGSILVRGPRPKELQPLLVGVLQEDNKNRII